MRAATDALPFSQACENNKGLNINTVRLMIPR